jgi:hypothetical protein
MGVTRIQVAPAKTRTAGVLRDAGPGAEFADVISIVPLHALDLNIA